jgi:ACT domain-containing protein
MYDIIDYCRSLMPGSDNQPPSIKVLPFHTGPVGLLPGTEVYVSLTEGPDGCEVLIKPYQYNQDNLMQLDCTMKDAPGVVGRLVGAVSSLDINIVNKVSAAIDIMKHHRVSMLVDWSTSKEHKDREPSTEAQRRYYHDYHSVFPIAIKRCVELFEQIALQCGDLIVPSISSGIALPMLNMRELPATPHLVANLPVTVKACKPYQVLIELPKSLYAMLCQSLVVRNDQPLVYITLSEPDTRTLRVFFPRPEDVSRIIHLAFFHLDIPHAYETILHPLAEAGFNILTSLIRRHKQGVNVVEAVLMASTPPQVPAKTRTSAEASLLCAWVAKLLVENLTQTEADLLQLCDLQVGLPLYTPKQISRETIGVSDLIAQSSVRQTPRARPVVEDCALTAFVRRGREVTSTTSVYLSHLPHAYLNAALLKKALEGRYRFFGPLCSSAGASRDDVQQEIRECDYFIGIWLPEATDSFASVSIELGMAVGLGKRAIILHPDTVDQELFRQLGPIVLPVRYSYPEYASHTMTLMRDKYCPEHFRDSPAASSARPLARHAETVRDSGEAQFIVPMGSIAGERTAEPNRAAFARSYIQKNPQGVTVAELYQAFIKEGIAIKRTYLSSLLGRLQEQERIKWRRDDKRFYYYSTEPSKDGF